MYQVPYARTYVYQYSFFPATVLNSTQSLFANNRKYGKTQQYNIKWQVAREA